MVFNDYGSNVIRSRMQRLRPFIKKFEKKTDTNSLPVQLPILSFHFINKITLT